MDPVGLIGLIYDVSKDLYTYYITIKECETDIKELRTQLLLLQHMSSTVTKALQHDGLRNEDKTQVDEAVRHCGAAAAELKSALDKIKLDVPHPQKILEKLKTVGRKAVYPFKKSTIAGLTEEIETCQDGLRMAISILQLNISAASVEQLRELDTKLETGTTKLELAFRDLEKSNTLANDEIIQELSRQRKMLMDDAEKRNAFAIVDSLKYPEMLERRHSIPEADESSLGWLFTQKSCEYPEVTNLMTFLSQENGLFWIQGKPASGKSTFVKYLLNRSQGRDKRWSWTGAREVVFASHFCWIAGTPMQKSQQGLLQTLLYQTLSSDLALVPIACRSQWATGANHGSWYIKELWDCLYAAIAASEKRICFFIDGVDEIEPEKDHIPIAKAIVRLSACANVKVITSSRPWPEFERIFKGNGRVLMMESANRISIVNYIREELESKSTDETFSNVSWSCIESGCGCTLKVRERHDDAYFLVQSIVDGANGVFLWVALILEAVRRHVDLGCPIAVLRSYIDTLPNTLEEYFRTMIFKRTHESLISETAMVLKIASLAPLCSISDFTLVFQYTDSGVSWLTDPNFCSTLPCSTCTLDELEDIIQKTAQRLNGCCRDLITCSSWCRPPVIGVYDTVCTGRYHTAGFIKFTHRTIFDFLHTPEMQSTLERHIPKHFMEDSFQDQLRIAACKLALTDENARHSVFYPWQKLSLSIRGKLGGRYSHLAAITEEVALHQFETLTKSVALPVSPRQWLSEDVCTSLSIELSAYGLFSFTDTVMHLAPQLLASALDVSIALNGRNVLFGHDRKNSLGILSRLLQAGLDSNVQLDDYPGIDHRDTVWRIFVRQLRSNTHDDPESETGSHESCIAQRHQDLSGDNRNIEQENLLSDLDVQAAVKLFIEFGADLTFEDAAMLNSCMPQTMAGGREWSEFLITYSQADKRKELREDRKARIRDWGEEFWSVSDRRLLGLEPD